MFPFISEAQPGFPPLAKEGQGGFEEVVISSEEICPLQISPAPSLPKRGTQVEPPRQKQATEMCRYSCFKPLFCHSRLRGNDRGQIQLWMGKRAGQSHLDFA